MSKRPAPENVSPAKNDEKLSMQQAKRPARDDKIVCRLLVPSRYFILFNKFSTLLFAFFNNLLDFSSRSFNRQARICN